MKKKIFSTLLMGVLFVASVGMFSSCKNYDDDISNLQGQIDKAALKSEVEAMQATLSTTSTNASSALTTAQSALTKANLGVTADQLAAVKTAAENAGKDAATAITNAAAASKAASDAADAAKAAQTSADQKISDAVKAQQIQNDDLNQKLIDLGKLVDTKVTADQLNQSLGNLKADIMGNATENLGALQKEVENYQSSINALYSAVTGVSVIASYTNSGKDYQKDLLLTHGLQVADYTFGYEYDKDHPSSPTKLFSKGADIDTSFIAGLIVKVDPVNADPNTAKVILVNSKGEDMSDYIEVGKVVRDTDDLLTRSSNIGCGLWKVPCHVKKGVTEEEFKKHTTTADGHILLAVAVNNTTSQKEQGGADRYVTSAYEVTTDYVAYKNANDFTFKVDNRELPTIHNRWDGSNIVSENNTSLSTNPEQAWKNEASVTIKDNTKNAASDARFNQKLYPVVLNKPFTIKLEGTNAEYYYVALDDKNAIESAPSERNAWKNYSCTGLLKTTKAGDKLEITITDQNALNDIIGFRVYAVNYDGTLADPDGKAFYVQVAAPAHTRTAGGDGAKLNLQGSDIFSVTGSETFVPSTDGLSGEIQLDQESSAKVALGTSLKYVLCKDENGTPASNWSEATYVKISYDAGFILDDAILKGSCKATDNIGSVINTLNISVKKEMPKAETYNPWKPEQIDDNGIYKCYVDPTDGWNTNSATGSKDFSQAVYYKLSANNYRWTITNGISGTQDLVFYGNDLATVAQAKVDNKTKHSTKLEYLYRGISCTDVTNKTGQDYPVEVWSGNTIFCCALDPSVQSYSWKLGFKNQITYEQSGFTIKAADYLEGHNAYENDTFGGAFKAQYIPGSYVATLTSGKPGTIGNQDYFTVAFDGTTFTFTPQSKATNPIDDVPSTLTVKAKDAFGHTTTIFSLDFTVLRKH